MMGTSYPVVGVTELPLQWTTMRELGGKLAKLYTPEEMMIWLFSPNRLLDGWAPAVLIQQRRTHGVIRLVEQILEGGHSESKGPI